MNKTINQVGMLLTDRAEFALTKGHCAQCGWEAGLPEPHHPLCTLNPNRTGKVHRFQLHGTSNMFNQINPQ